MTVTINLPPEMEAEVTALATETGVALEDYLPLLIRRALPSSQQPLRQGSQEWLDLLNTAPPVAWIDPATGQAPPSIPLDSLRREQLYEDRA